MLVEPPSFSCPLEVEMRKLLTKAVQSIYDWRCEGGSLDIAKRMVANADNLFNRVVWSTELADEFRSTLQFCNDEVRLPIYSQEWIDALPDSPQSKT
jgi:hypothetical protein